MDLKAEIGKKSRLFSETATPERVKAFCQAISATHCDGIPPTYFTICRKGEFELLQAMGVQLAQVLHAEQEYQYVGKARVGDAFEYETTFSQFAQKQGSAGSMSFLIFETQIRSGQSVVATARTNIVVRSHGR